MIIGIAGVFYACNKDNNLVNQKEVSDTHLMGQTQAEKHYRLYLCYTQEGKNGTNCQGPFTSKQDFPCSNPRPCEALPDKDQPVKVSMQIERIMADYGELKLYKEFIKEFWETFDYLYKIKELIHSPNVLYDMAPTKEEYYKKEEERKKDEESNKNEAPLIERINIIKMVPLIRID